MAIVKSSNVTIFDKAFGPIDVNNIGQLAYDGSEDVVLEKNKTYLFIADSACYFHLSSDRTAATSAISMYLPADQYLVVKTGSTKFLSAIKHTDAGTIHYCKLD